MTTWFGFTAHTGLSNAINGNRIYLQKATCNATGNVDTARSWVTDTLSALIVRHVIYSVVAGVPSVPLGSSNALSLGSGVGSGMQTFTYGTPVAVVNGTEYAIGYISDTNGLRIDGDSATTTLYHEASTYPTLTNPFSPSTATTSIYAQEAGVAGAGGVFRPLIVVSY